MSFYYTENRYVKVKEKNFRERSYINEIKDFKKNLL